MAAESAPPRALKLSTGALMPDVGLGTFMRRRAYEPGTCKQMAVSALEAGYRHIDCASMYANEVEVGEGIREVIENKDNDITREDIFVVTKLWNQSHEPERVETACRLSLEKLGLDYVDVYLMHWPVAFKWVNGAPIPRDENGQTLVIDVPLEDTYKAMEALVDKGLAKAIGVCNTTPDELRGILASVTKHKPVTLQVEVHPYFIQTELKQICDENDIVMTAYCSLGNVNPANPALVTPLKDPLINEIAAKYKKSAAQIILKWHLAYGIVPLTKSSHPGRIRENYDIFDFELTADEVASITALDRDHRTTNPPTFKNPSAPFWPR